MSKRDRPGELEEVFEILVTSYAQKGGVLPGENDLCWRPATDAYETEDAFIVQMDLAGMDPGRIEVLADHESLVVRGVRQDTTEPGKKHFHKMEINVGPFTRRVAITLEVDPTRATATYKGGFLFVTFPKGAAGNGTRRQIAIDR
jgi:HSP20 family molecular chaperone IbpA